MKRLYQKMIRDIIKLKVQFFSIFVMCFIGMFVYAGIEAVWYGMEISGNEYFLETNLADLWVDVKDISSKNLKDIKNIKGVSNIEKIEYVDVKIDNKYKTNIRIIQKKDNKISKPKNIQGEKYLYNKHGIWLNDVFFEQSKFKIGDSIILKNGSEKKKLKILGSVLSPEYVKYVGNSSYIRPNHFLNTYAYGDIDFKNSIVNKQLQLKLSKNVDSVEIKKEIKNILKNNYIGSYLREEYNNFSDYNIKIVQIKKLSIMFSSVFLFLALLTIETTMKRVVKNQRTQIGILKAMGFSNNVINFHYSLYGFFVSFFGAILGYLCSPLLSLKIIKLNREFYEVDMIYKNTWFAICLLILMVCISTFTAYITSRKVVNQLPSNIMRDEPPKKIKKLFIEEIPIIWNLFKFGDKWIIRDIIKNKIRAIIGIVGVAGSIVLLMAGFAMTDTVYHVNNSIYGKQYTYNKKITLKRFLTNDEKKEIDELLDGDYQYISRLPFEFQNNKVIKMGIVDVIDDGYYYLLKDEKGKTISLTDGVVISKLLAKKLKVSENEYIKLSFMDKKYIVKIDKIVNISTPQGIFMSKKYYEEKLGGIFSENILLVGNNKNVKKIEKKDYVDNSYILSDELEEANNMISSINSMLIVLKIAAIVLSIVILYNLGILTYTERYREYATLKVLGFYNSEIKSIIFKDSIFSIIIGVLFGIPLGQAFLIVYIDTLSNIFISYTPYISYISMFYTLLISIGCSILVSFVVVKKVKDIDMIEALKSVE